MCDPRVSNPMNANATAGSSASASFRESSLRRPARWLHGARSRRRSATCRVWVITDEQIVEACKREARTIDELFMVRGMREKLNTRDARTVAGLAKKALESGPQSWPELDRSGRNEPNVDALLDLMSALVRLRAKENGVAFPTLASHDDLVRMARGYRQGIDLLQAGAGRSWARSSSSCSRASSYCP